MCINHGLIKVHYKDFVFRIEYDMISIWENLRVTGEIKYGRFIKVYQAAKFNSIAVINFYMESVLETLLTQLTLVYVSQ